MQKGAGNMKIQWMIPVILGTAICLTGCGKTGDLTVQEDSVPVVPIETAAFVLVVQLCEALS